jgi:hypothetical protein
MANKVISYQTAEYGKFEEIVNNTQYPAVSVVNWSYPDASSAFPGNSGIAPLSSVSIYPKYAILSKIVNPEDITISLSAGNLNVNLADIENLITTNNTLLNAISAQINTQLGQKGFDFITPSSLTTGNWTTITAVTATKFAAIDAKNSTTTGMTNYELPVTFTFFGPITAIQLTYGAVIAYKS